MSENFPQFVKSQTTTFFTALANIFIFLPYFFSVPQLLRTLFYPWKKLVAKKERPGFTLSEWLGRASFNLISAGVGFALRSSIILFYIFTQTLFVVSLPFLVLFFLVLLPFLYIFKLARPSPKERKETAKKEFLKTHLLDQKNKDKVEEWFKVYYQRRYHQPWWHLKSLFSTPPFARDWSVGYTPTLDQYSEELTQPKSHFKNLVDREKELKQIEQSLSRSREANVVIVGEEGVGKHTIVEALARKIYEGAVNPVLSYKRVMKIDIEKIVSEGIDITQKENLLKTTLQEAKSAGNTIVLIDNLDKYIATGPDRTDFSNIIESFAASDKIQFIAITTPFFYQKFVFPNEKIRLLFEKVDVYEIKEKEAEEILLRVALDFEKRFNVTVPYETIKEAVKKSAYYITYIPFPEKAIELLDETCVFALQQSQKPVVVKPNHVDSVLTQKTHVPVTLDESLKRKLMSLEEELSKKIIFQKEPIAKLSSSLRNSFVKASKRKKPLASFLFLGPTGVGKTETAKALSQVFFGSKEHLLRFDMSFYQSKQDIPNLLGSQQTANPGLLVKAIRERPYGVLLLDEIEKAHPDLLNIFLTLLDEGYITDGFGEKVDAKNLIIIATSNAGSDFIYQNKEKIIKDSTVLIDHLIEAKSFSPEFLNRFDGAIVYKPLTKKAVFDIARKMLTQIAVETEKSRGIKMKFSDQFIEKLAQKGFDQKFGARHLERVIRNEVEDRVAKLILKDKIKEGETIEF